MGKDWRGNHQLRDGDKGSGEESKESLERLG